MRSLVIRSKDCKYFQQSLGNPWRFFSKWRRLRDRTFFPSIKKSEFGFWGCRDRGSKEIIVRAWKYMIGLWREVRD